MLVADIAAALPFEQPLDVEPHVAGVMLRLDTPLAVRRGARLLAWCGGLAAAAAVLLLFSQLHAGGAGGTGVHTDAEFAARGGPTLPLLSRDVGVQLYAEQPALVALGSGSRITTKTALTAGLRNVAGEPAYLLLFAVDAERAVHWLAPEYTSAGSNPEAFPIAPAGTERLLPSSVVFDDLARGSLRVLALISKTPLHVSDIEALSPRELGAEALRKRFPHAQVRAVSLDVR